MPKAYSDIEKEKIISDLKNEAINCMFQYGIRKTTVDELVKRVNIPKGTFYLFYESKELLLFEAIMDLHNRIQDEIIKELSTLPDDVDADRLTDVLYKCYKQIDIEKIIWILSNGELEVLVRKLPNDKISEHMEHDNDMIHKLIELLPAAKDKPTEVYSSAFRAIFLSTLHKQEIGEKYFDDAIYLLFKGLVQMLLQ